MDDRLIDLGVVVGAHGLKGLLRVKLFSPDCQGLAQVRMLVVRHPGGEIKEIRTHGFQAGSKGQALIALEGVLDRDAAEALVGMTLCARREHLPSLDPDEFYLADAVGVSAVSSSGDPLGTVVAIGDNGAQPLLFLEDGVVRYHVPAVPPFIQAFDGVSLVLELPEGLREAVAEPMADQPQKERP